MTKGLSISDDGKVQPLSGTHAAKGPGFHYIELTKMQKLKLDVLIAALSEKNEIDELLLIDDLFHLANQNFETWATHLRY